MNVKSFDNFDLHDEAAYDLALAAELQAALLPTSCPSNCGHQVAAARNRMCGSVGGDFYDFIRINDEQVVFVIGDVVGHGVRASLLMAKIMGWLRSEPENRARPIQVVSALNKMLITLGERIGQVMLCSIFYAVIDLPSGSVFFINAGHPRPLVYDRTQRKLNMLGGLNMLLGVREFEPVEGCHTFGAGERFVLYTDGLTDAANPEGESFGEKRILQTIRDTGELSADGCADGFFAAVDAFRGSAQQKDDETIVIIDRVD